MGYYKIYHGIVYLGVVYAECKYEARKIALARYANRVKDFDCKYLNIVKMK